MNKFREIFLDLEQKIVNQEYPPQSLLPSENQLIQIYGVSRETIRKALNLLKNSGYIQKKQGKGSIVLDMNRFDFPISGLTSFKELQNAQHIPNETNVAELRKIAVSPKLHEITDWPVASEAWKLIRQRKIDNEVVILDRDYVNAQIIPEIPINKAQDSLFQYFENDLGLEVSYAQKEITVEPVNKEIRDLMDLTTEDQHVVIVRSLVYLEDTRCFQYSESIHRLDKFRFVDFARRRKV
ncbi:trehalose operon repressor [Enterococcus asini]|uniref:Trehalose operon repressor n=2 Tax=Enterococcus asini TaxID=57732 RepID=R2PMP5_9ENTE|nr:trehalose operon repressor [Enterococcus asini]EOH84409.1 trehalose operon repressor [Enterococcus asini ATCC 700915]EOH84568.1 trehalose operon repressor [Enterococcus asini ATCC 700915]EOT57299.1 trehalose operon repressor [Enterococcus asini ATCC 700915]MCD5028864.1 trehalose operon repressor [Enterococcus asini]MDT2764028.1 trehalose operon repressor [Enterococcus asini]